MPSFSAVASPHPFFLAPEVSPLLSQANIFRGLRKWHKERLPQQARAAFVLMPFSPRWLSQRLPFGNRITGHAQPLFACNATLLAIASRVMRNLFSLAVCTRRVERSPGSQLDPMPPGRF